MPRGQLSTVVRHLHQLAGFPPAELSDAELLRRFAARRDETAFTLLVERHGPMVLGVCRRILGNAHDAEDAFQATFLLLVRKARALRKPEALGGWLHEVALRTALRARSQAATRRLHERQVPEMPPSDFLAAVAWRDLQPVLDEEVQRLPQKFRVPFVLCYLEGRTYEQAARHLSCLPGTISRRLAQARELLRSRLTRRGLALPAGVLAAALAECSAAATLPVPLATSTVKVVLQSAAGQAAGAIPAQVAALVDGGLRAMTLTKVKTVGAVLLAATLTLAGIGWLTHQALATCADETGEPGTAAVKPEQPKSKPAPKKGAGDRLTLRGRVVDPEGRPVAAASILALTLPTDPPRGGEESVRLDLQDSARANDDGRFRVRLPRPGDNDLVPGVVVVRAPGFGVGFHAARPEDGKAEVVIRLPREQVLRGRLVDLQGAAVAGVELRVAGVLEPLGDDKEGMGVAEPAKASPGWFAPLRTNKDGRFELRGIGPRQIVMLDVRDKRFRPERLKLWTTAADRGREVVHGLEAARLVSGRVTYGDTGKPAAGATITTRGVRVQTDKDGRYRINPFGVPGHSPGHDLVMVQAPPGEPYVGRIRFRPQAKGAPRERELDFKLERGVLVRGKVIDEGSLKPLAGATVCFLCPRAAVANPREGGLAIGLGLGVVSGADGSFTLPVLSGPGNLLVSAASPDYILHLASLNKLASNREGGARLYLHGVQPTDFPEGSGPHDVTLRLRRGVTVRGKLVGPDGQPVKQAQMLTRLTTNSYFMGFTEVRGVTVRGPDFVLNSCDPVKPYPVVFLDERGGSGARVEISGKQSGKPLTVRLERCGSAVARFIKADGDPVVGLWAEIEVVFVPGPSQLDPKAVMEGKLAADAVHLANVYSRNYHWKDFRTDSNGRIAFPMLVPGVTYRIVSSGMSGAILREFTVRPGERLDLKDIVLKVK
jgi:RNA polymerase sigma factor (sigma-70 family)